MITHEVNPRYLASSERYEKMPYQRCGKSGLRLPRLSLGLWQNFGAVDSLANARAMVHRAFDLGITHFDLANNYGPNYGSAESTFGQIMAEGFDHYRDEMIISSKAGYDMWPGPYGIGGSRKYLVASCDQSLKRCGVEYFDIFYSHCFDPETPLEETMMALDYIVRSGRALYAGISSYSPEQTREAAAILKDLGTPLLIHQPRYNMMDRWIEDGLTDVLDDEGVGAIVFSPLNQGILTNKYLGGIPENSRASRGEQIYLNESDLSDEVIAKVNALNNIAEQRGQTLAQLAIAWVLNNKTVTSAIIGASRVEQINDSVAALNNLDFTDKELTAIDTILK
ncbi:L-glyceraldehyde 3-phosphate reductase [Gilvimarinus sp. SDUM040013]|uniref:L-glyceraldehyde 3-phosphate reductase n=1 Tax=Gilvimarinus gilvus TaxID=3058038 RepID=A0ABU4RXF0_9GAMM|nr:L-glyceraldehyde 3-phosphate reductase [Gilvimarinus sp. SDUM040013]MDO3386613.1 L-glyceraldehyde 3-phosphate reductase [Gilvimarinus sp. SDUM040013]MDX6849500.1 L-glyceraldehyde 3-phosphate reductase [Gilvimarinus sp. SDUM040013]